MTSNEEFDLNQLIDLFDTALSSDNPSVKKALKNLLLVATLVDSDTSAVQKVSGPLRKLVDDLNRVSLRLSKLESQTAKEYKKEVYYKRDWLKDDVMNLNTAQSETSADYISSYMKQILMNKFKNLPE